MSSQRVRCDKESGINGFPLVNAVIGESWISISDLFRVADAQLTCSPSPGWVWTACLKAALHCAKSFVSLAFSPPEALLPRYCSRIMWHLSSRSEAYIRRLTISHSDGFITANYCSLMWGHPREPPHPNRWLTCGSSVHHLGVHEFKSHSTGDVSVRRHFAATVLVIASDLLRFSVDLYWSSLRGHYWRFFSSRHTVA